MRLSTCHILQDRPNTPTPSLSATGLAQPSGASPFQYALWCMLRHNATPWFLERMSQKLGRFMVQTISAHYASEGKSQRWIAKELQIDRKTVRKIIQLIGESLPIAE